MQNNPRKPNDAIETLKNWTIALLTVAFVLLYAAALLGWLKPLSDVTMVSRLEPIIFVIIGYYFGRFPSQRNEESLKEEISRMTELARTATEAKESAAIDRETLEEKIRNVRAVLSSHQIVKARATGAVATAPDESVEIAIRILET